MGWGGVLWYLQIISETSRKCSAYLRRQISESYGNMENKPQRSHSAGAGTQTVFTSPTEQEGQQVNGFLLPLEYSTSAPRRQGEEQKILRVYE